ncbi:MAG: urease accessory protein UreD [Verrucomicrobia bacterium]|nr:urease accessory protein UreD [Verrucomicrobiota bacterium]
MERVPAAPKGSPCFHFERERGLNAAQISSIDIKRAPGGHATLEVQQVAGESAVTSVVASSPLKLLTPRARGQSVWAFTSSFGGGLVAGDQTRLDLRLGAGARCFVGTQASTKIYRNPSCRPCGHVTQAALEAGSLLVLAPDPVQPFAHSIYAQQQEFHLGPGAGLVLVDWFCSGRAARGERWAFNRFQSRNEVWSAVPTAKGDFASSLLDEAAAQTPSPPSDGGEGRGEEAHCSSGFQSEIAPLASSLPTRPSRGERDNGAMAVAHGTRLGERASDRPEARIFLDSLHLDSADGSLGSSHRTGRFNCCALLLVLGPPVRQIAVQLLETVSQRPVTRGDTVVCSASPVCDGALLRVAAETVERAGREIHRHLEPVIGLLGDDPFARKW